MTPPHGHPRIVGFLCNWCAYEGADAAGRARAQMPPNLSVVRVMCSGQVAPQFVLEAFRAGADGVLVMGCPHGECHYKTGNRHALKQTVLLIHLLSAFNISEARLQVAWVGAREWKALVRVAEEMTETLSRLGPLHPKAAPAAQTEGTHGG